MIKKLEITSELKKQKDFYLPVLNILVEAGNEIHINDICDIFLLRYKSQMDASFFTEIKDGDIKWRDWINRAGYQLTKRGFISRGSKRGYWRWSGKDFSNGF